MASTGAATQDTAITGLPRRSVTKCVAAPVARQRHAGETPSRAVAQVVALCTRALAPIAQAVARIARPPGDSINDIVYSCT
jgi:hypothetical protein